MENQEILISNKVNWVRVIMDSYKHSIKALQQTGGKNFRYALISVGELGC